MFRIFTLVLFVIAFQFTASAKLFETIGDAGVEQGQLLALDHQGNIYLAGSFIGTTDLDPGTSKATFTSAGPTTTDIFIAKYDKDGKYIWGFTLGGLQNDTPTDLKIDDAGDVFLCGSFTGTVNFNPKSTKTQKISKGKSDAFLAKYNSDGILVWVDAFGGIGDDIPTSMFVDILGSISVTGYFDQTINLDPTLPPNTNAMFTSNGSTDIFVANYNDLGDYEYGFSIGGAGEDKAYAITLDSDLSLILAGSFQQTVDFEVGVDEYPLTSSGPINGFIVKYDIIGTLMYGFKLTTVGQSVVNKLVIDASDNIISAGTYTKLCNFNPNGTANLTPKVKSDIFLAKYDVDGKYIWAYSTAADSLNSITSLTADKDNNLVITGIYAKSISLDLKNQLKSFTSLSKNNWDGFLAKYNQNCDLLWTAGVGYDKPLGGLSFNHTAFDDSLNIISTGNIYSTSTFYSEKENLKLSAFGGGIDAFLVKYTKDGLIGADAPPTPKLVLSTPNGGEKWSVGKPANINWTSENILSIKIDISYDNGANWEILRDNVDAALGTLSITVPDHISDKCLVKLTSKPESSPSSISDVSNSNFSIVKDPVAYITLVQPNGGEQILIGSTYEIKWESALVARISILISSNNGSTWNSLFTNVLANLGKISWDLSTTPAGTQYSIKITDDDGKAPFAQCDSAFTIYDETNVHDIALSNISLYPNPASNFIDVAGVPENSRLKLINSLGQEIQLLSLNDSNNIRIDLSGLQSGIYYLQINSSNEVKIEKIILMK